MQLSKFQPQNANVKGAKRKKLNVLAERLKKRYLAKQRRKKAS